MARAPAARRIEPADPTYYPETDHMGESALHRFISEVLRALVAAFMVTRKKRAFVGANQFIYYRKHAPTISVAPDVYVLPGVDPSERPRSWKTWETGIVPSWAFECVSEDWEKDYRDGPPRYAEIGTDELVIFDPAANARSGERLRWQVWRRLPRRGLVRVEASNADRVKSTVLGCWLRAVGTGDTVVVRLATGARGDDLVPTEVEEQALRVTELQRENTEVQRENEALRAELERLRGGRRS